MALSSGTVAIVGRTNVGKSTLFNRLCGGRDALVHDQPGLTRDRKYGFVAIDGKIASVIDTGGLFDSSTVGDLVTSQANQAIDEADVVLVLLDASVGLTSTDETLIDDLRKLNKPIRLALNKIDGVSENELLSLRELNGLGFGEVQFISASHGDGISDLRTSFAEYLGDAPLEATQARLSIAVIGRPNVGKSTLVNSILGDERCVVFDEPGTTRDSIYIPFERDNQQFTLIDTAGIRRKGRVSTAVEKFSVIKALDAMRVADVAFLLVDASEGLVEQDLHIITHALELGTSIALVVNKIDRIDGDHRRALNDQLARKMRFAEWVPIRYTVATVGTGVQGLFDIVNRMKHCFDRPLSTSQLNRTLSTATQRHEPPFFRGRKISVRYANLVNNRPPTILIHGNNVESLPAAYLRYLEKTCRLAHKLDCVPVVIKTQNSDNPFSSRRNELTDRQVRQRRRLIQHRKDRARRLRNSSRTHRR